MNTEPVTNAVAAFLRFFRPVYMSPIQIAVTVQHIPLGAAIRNRNFQCAAFTGFIGTGLAFSAFYSFNGGPHEHKANDTFTPVQWFEYADYVPPVMDLFAEDQVPFGVSPMLSCHKDSEHLEHAFDLLCHRYLPKKHGVLPVVNPRHLPHLLRTLGNTSGPYKIDGGSSDSTSGEDYADYESRASYPNPYLMAMAMANSTWLPPVSDDEESNGEPISDWAGINTASIIVAFTVFGLLAKRSRSRPSSELSTTLEREVQGTSSGNDNDNPPGTVKEPSSRLVLAFLMNPETFMEQLIEDNPQVESYTPYVVLKFLEDDVNSNVRSNIGFPEDASAPDGFAARFYALQDALLSSQEFKNVAESFPRDLAGFARLVLFGAAILPCFALRIMGFLVTGHFGRRGLQQLVQEFKDDKTSESTFAVELANDDALCGFQPVETPERQEIELSAGGSELSNSTKPSEVGDDTRSDVVDHTHVDSAIQEAYEGIVEVSIKQPPSSTSASAVETHLAPVIKEEKPGDDRVVTTLVKDPIPCPTPTSAITTDVTHSTTVVNGEISGDEGVVTPHTSCPTSTFSTPPETTVETTLAPVEDDGGNWTVVAKKRRGGRRGKDKATDIAPEEHAQANSE